MNGGLFVENASRRFGDEVVVDGVDLTVAEGEIHAIVGLNGAGKTTLMRMMLGMLHPTDGAIRVGGKSVPEMRGDDWSVVGSMIETPFLYPELTVEENLTMSLRLKGVPRVEADDRVSAVVDRLGLSQWRWKRARVLSLGNRQRLGLAAAIAHEPSLLVLDEPANALDPAGVILVREILRESAASGAAVLVSSHHLDEIARVADRITVLHRGRVVGEVDPSEPDIERRFFDLAYQADVESGLVDT